MAPEEEGIQAAESGLDLKDCPYTYSNKAISMDQYLTGGWEQKRNEWVKGWLSYFASPDDQPTD